MKLNWNQHHDYIAGEILPGCWAKLRAAVKARARGICERCGNEDDRGEVHHKTYIRLGEERLDDLEYQCRFCHGYRHGRRKYDPLEHSHMDIIERELKDYLG